MKRCKLCGGTGVIYDRNIQAGSHGELRVCDCIEKQCRCGGIPPYQIFDENGGHSWCVCRTPRMRLEATKRAFRESDIPRKYRWKFCEDFDTGFEDPKYKQNADRIIGTIGTIKDKQPLEKWKNGFYFYGPPGSGKTLLSCIFLQELMLKYSRRGKFVDLSRQFFQRLRSSYDAGDESYGKTGRILDELIEVPYLVIDDFGTQRNTEWESEMLYNLIDSRYEQEKITIITSNLSLKEYIGGNGGRDGGKDMYVPKGIGTGAGERAKDSSKGWEQSRRTDSRIVAVAKERIYSRIHEMCRIIHVDLPDYRKKFSEFI